MTKKNLNEKQEKVKKNLLKLSIPFTVEQLNFLNEMHALIKVNRQFLEKKEKINKGSIIRCMVNILKEKKPNLEKVVDESDLERRIRSALSTKIPLETLKDVYKGFKTNRVYKAVMKKLIFSLRDKGYVEGTDEEMDNCLK